jgi:hypothetical protein
MISTTTLATLTLILAAVPAVTAIAASAGEPAIPWEERSRALADQLMSELQAELQQAMQQGGPVAAIVVCRTRAPEIASRLSQSSGAAVGRTALRVRNPANAPDELERAVLQGFVSQLERVSSPASPPPSARIELHSAQGIERRYLRAIPMQPLCVTCHGSTLSQEVAAAIARDYPQDAATGFDPGQLRGAVTVRWPTAP